MGIRIYRWALLTLATLSTVSHAGTSANFGWVSEYIFRGIPQSDSSAYLGIDHEADAGFYVGLWAADVEQGAEVDGYFGYTGNFNDQISFGLGYTGYFYTDDFDDTYQEVEVSLGFFDAVSVAAAFGEYDNFDGPVQDYTHIAITAEHKGFYGVVGSFQRDFDGEYFEVGYGLDLGGFEASISVVHGTDDLVGDEDTSIVFGLSKTFDLN